jgi:hypothetical protein
MANEVALLTAVYTLYCFAGLTPAQEVKYEAAKWLTYLLYFMLVLNFSIAIFLTVLQM